MEIKYSQAIHANKLIKEKLGEVCGDTAIKISFLRHDISSAFAPYDERQQKVVGQLQALRSEEPSEKDKAKIKSLNKELQEMYKKSEEVSLSKGKLTVAELREAGKDTVDVLTTLDFAIDFEPEEAPAKNGKAKEPVETE